MKVRTGILDVYFPRLQMFYSMKSFDVRYGCTRLSSWKIVERLSESISLSELIQQRKVVALKQRVLFNIK